MAAGHSAHRSKALTLCSRMPLITFSFRAACASIMRTSSLNCPTAARMAGVKVHVVQVCKLQRSTLRTHFTSQKVEPQCL